jgi:DNA-binding transcriptional ArsR family regulator
MKSPYPRSVYLKNAEIYRLLANPVRLEILNMLKDGPASVEDLIKALKLRKANVSQHLSLLRLARLVHVERHGKRASYSITDPMIVEPCRILRDVWRAKKFR